ncbi:MAG: M48 family metallopeptidase [Thalassotalea sp.]
MHYQLIRSKRKSIALQVLAGKVIVRAPLLTSINYIERLLTKKLSWIEDKINRQDCDKQNLNQFVDGGKIWFNGKQHPLTVTKAVKNSIIFNENGFLITLKNARHKPSKTDQSSASDITASRIKKMIEVWLKQQAQRYLIPQTKKLSIQMSLTPMAINIRQYKARWGSCNSLGNIQFNYLLMMAPQWVVDYVIVHELSHLAHLNHGSEFWQLVEKHYPEYQSAKHWLKSHQQQLQWVL